MPIPPEPIKSSRVQALAEAFKALTYREMQDLAEVMSEALDGQNGLKVKPTVMAEVLDSFGEYLALETT